MVFLYVWIVFGMFMGCSDSEEIIDPPVVLPPEEVTPPEEVLSQVQLKANSPGETYELINSVFAPGYNVVEAPDCSHPDFGRHIDEVYDDVLGAYVFQFKIHTTPDNDRCLNFDRQRNEIKTYDKSPENVKGVVGEKVVYNWKFRLPSDFQSSPKFTHIHQIKAVGGSESSMPLITLTTRKSSPDRLELRYAEHTSQETLKQVPLEAFLGVWLEVTETIVYGEAAVGTYSIAIKNVANQEVLFSYENPAIRMWKTDAEFMRPKWGIYRSLNYVEDLKDETLKFADFSIKEIAN